MPEGASFFRQTYFEEIIDSNTEEVIGQVPANQLAGRLFSSTDPSGPAAAVTAGVGVPPHSNGNPAILLGALRLDGSEAPASEIVLPNGLNGSTSEDDGLISIIWAVEPAGTAWPTGTYTIARLATNIPLSTSGMESIIHPASKMNTVVGSPASGAPGPKVDVPNLFIVPEPSSGLLVITALLTARLRRH